MPRVGDDGQWITTRPPPPPPPPPRQAPPPGPPGNAPSPPPGSATRTQVLGKIALEIGKRPALLTSFGVEWFESLESEQFLDEHTPPASEPASQSLASRGAGGMVTYLTQVKPKPASSAARFTIPAQPLNKAGPASEHPVVRHVQSSSRATPLAPRPASQHSAAHRPASFESTQAHPTAALTEDMHQHGRVLATAAPAAGRPPRTKPTTATALRPSPDAADGGRTARPSKKTTLGSVLRGAKTSVRPAPLHLPTRQLTVSRSTQAFRSRAASAPAKAAATRTRQALKNPVTRKRASDIYTALLILDFTPLQAAAFLGNFFEESIYTLDPNTVQIGGGPGRGFAQWSITPRPKSGHQKPRPGRWEFENRFAKQEGLKPHTFEAELDFLIAEVTDILPPLRGTHDNFFQLHHQLSASSARQDLGLITKQVMKRYENPDRRKEQLSSRIAAADVINTTFGAAGRRISDLPGPLKALFGQALVLGLARGTEAALVLELLPTVK